MKKDWIENLVFEQVEIIVQDDELLENIANEVLKEQAKENTALPMLKNSMQKY